MSGRSSGRVNREPGLIPLDLGPDQFVRPSEIRGIEVYKGLGTAPPQFQGWDSGCGVIVIWTKREM